MVARLHLRRHVTVVRMRSAHTQVESLVRDALVWDNHACLPLTPGDDRFLPELQRYRSSGVDAVSINIGFGEQSIEQHFRMAAHFRSWLLKRPEEFLMVRSAGDVMQAKRDGRLAVMFDIEGANAIGDQLSLISLYYDIGVRWMLMAYNRNNRVGGGCLDDDRGLTAFGRDVVAEMNRVGMVPCCSHCGKRTALDVIETSATPVIFSHSNPRAIWDHPRNIDDEVMRACAERGGVIGINGVGRFLGPNDTSSATVARHIDYAARLVGPDHVALGLDYVFDRSELAAFIAADPAMFGENARAAAKTGLDFVAPEQLTEIVDSLSSLGHAESDIRKILGLNLLRIAHEVWK